MIQDMLPITEQHIDEIMRLLNYGKAWCQGSPARKRNGDRCLAHDAGVAKLCINAAISLVFPLGTKFRYFTEQDLTMLRIKNDKPIVVEELVIGRATDKNRVWESLMDALCALMPNGLDWQERYPDSGPRLAVEKKKKRKSGAKQFSELFG